MGDAPDPTGGGHPDAHTSNPIDSAHAVDAPRPIDAAFVCRDKITSGLDSGHHNAGQDCQNGCHDHGFYMSGTLYAAANGGSPVAGASITFYDSESRTGDMHTGTNGNFGWSLPVTFPVTIIASACPDIQPMTMTLQSGDGGCNKGGCHVAGAAGRIHLP